MPPAPSVGDDPTRWLVVDAMNVIGSRPDGWWRDRAGAIRRFLGRLADYAADRPGPVTAVVDRPATDGDRPDRGPLTVVDAGTARNAADDRIVALLDATGEAATVVTADRDLRRRARRRGASAAGPTRLLEALDALENT